MYIYIYIYIHKRGRPRHVPARLALGLRDLGGRKGGAKT